MWDSTSMDTQLQITHNKFEDDTQKEAVGNETGLVSPSEKLRYAEKLTIYQTFSQQVYNKQNLRDEEEKKRDFDAQDENFPEGIESKTQRRVKLLDLVVNQNYPVIRASRKLELKAYTARSIVNKYRKSGLVYDYTCRRFVPVDLPPTKKEENSEKNVKQEDNGSEPIQPLREDLQPQQVKREAPEEPQRPVNEPQPKREEPNQVYLFYYW